MRETIAGNPNESPGTVSVSGSWFETYVPHYSWGGRWPSRAIVAEALKEFEETERQGVSPRSPISRAISRRAAAASRKRKPAKPKEIVFETPSRSRRKERRRSRPAARPR